jgi:hypothetical protein
MSFWRARFLSSTVAIVAALAWFTSTNHCLLGVVIDSQNTAGSACHCSEPGKASDSQPNSPSLMLTCCQGLLSPALELAQTKVKFCPLLLWFQLAAVDHLVAFESRQFANSNAEYNTGPPKGDCFVSTVLKRSQPAHAPPFSI